MENIVSMIFDRSVQYGERDVFKYKKGEGGNYGNVSWKSFTDKVKQVSKALISLELSNSDNIGIFSENKPEWVISDIGILGSRCVVVPFYATASKQQLKYIVEETQMKLIFVGSQEQYDKACWLLSNTASIKKIVIYDSSITPIDTRGIYWQEFLDLGNDHRFEELFKQKLNEIQPDDLATIIYTSGTTGESKGVMLTHKTFMYTFKIHDERLDVTDSDVSVAFLPLSHVFERTWTYYILHCGATTVFIDNPREIVTQLPYIKPTLMCTVPRFFEKTYEGIQLELSKWSIIKRGIFNWAIAIGHKYSEKRSKDQKPSALLAFRYGMADKLVLSKLRRVFGGRIRFMPCAGAAISTPLLRFFHAAGIFIDYGYGATETTATVSCFKTDKYDFNSCGTIMPGIEVGITKEGEIKVKGGTVFNGYYKKPQDTETVLIDGWYHTGDQGYITPENSLVMTDRIKDLIKTSVGKYVSPQKLELLLGNDKFIEQIIVIGDKRKFITALIVPSFENLKKEAETIGLQLLKREELVNHLEIIKFYKKRIDQIQEELTPYERIVRFKLLPESFSIQNGMLTNTLKVRRNYLIEQYSELVEQLYSGY